MNQLVAPDELERYQFFALPILSSTAPLGTEVTGDCGTPLETLIVGVSFAVLGAVVRLVKLGVVMFVDDGRNWIA